MSTLLKLLPVVLLASAVHAGSPFGEATNAAWKTLSKSVQDRAHVLYPWEKACFPNPPADLATSGLLECPTVQENYLNESFQVDQPGSYLAPQWEACQATGEQCMLDFADVTNPSVLNSTCSQGSVSSAYVDAHSPADVIAALNFSRTTGVPLVVKNTGHDYKGRSSAPGSLAIWTHHMNNITYEESFTPLGCSEAFKAVTVEAGVEWGDVYDVSDLHNFTVLGGADLTVGAAGGWLQGGGHGFLSPSLGLGIDRVKQIRVVTADGQLRIANACENSDLFWALRGGGGGTFGVVVEATYLVAERRPIQAIIVRLKQDAATTKALWSVYIANAERWAKEGWGGSISASSILFVNQVINATQVAASMSPLLDFARSENVTVVLQDQGEFTSWAAVYKKFANSSPIGIPGALSSRLIPVDNFRGTEAQESLLNALLTTANSSLGLQMYAVTPYSAPFSAKDVSATPAWRNSLLHVVTGAVWTWNTSIVDVRAKYKSVSASMDNLRAITPAGAYQNEADVYEPDYEASFWGANYARLLEVKTKYDPDNMFTCHQCVGWTPDAARFRCYL